jgi:hypothetical protein
MSTVLRSWKCRHCGRANATAIGLDGTGTCEHCAAATQVQPSRLRNGVVLPATFPTRPRPATGAPATLIEDLGTASEPRPRR